MSEEKKKNEKIVETKNPLTFSFQKNKLEETITNFGSDTIKKTAAQFTGELPPKPPQLNPIPVNPDKEKQGEKEKDA